ncbi:MAG TPA: metallophosphoesterase [Methanocella sp.]|nr:metallophosphoesterase [Methanocella sp.]
MKIQYTTNAAYFPKSKICAVSDIHIGIEGALQAEGFGMPLNEEKELIQRFKTITRQFSPKTIILNGDILHEFGKLRKNTKKSFDRIITTLLSSTDKTILISGSHDQMLETALQNIDITSEPSYTTDGIMFTHGDTIPNHANDKNIKLIVIGHEHPALDVELKKEPCFLYGKKTWKNKDILVLPAFNPLCSGSSINYMNSQDFLSPFIQQSDIDTYQPIIAIKDETLKFPPLKKFKDILQY